MNTVRRTTAATLAAGLLLAACGGTDEPAGTADDPVTVTLLSHDSFIISDEVVAALAADGIDLELLPGGDAGSVVNQAILTVDRPQADLLFGIDSTLLTRGLDAGLFEAYEAPALENIPDTLELDPEHRVTPVDVSDVCINADLSAYGPDLAVPSTLDDLVDPAYAGQLVVMNPATSSPGLAFLLRTIAEYGEDGWQDWWTALVANDVEVTAGWEDAYYGVFSGGAGEGDRPLVVSYSTSPPAEVLFGPDPEATEAPTSSVSDTCYRQVEFVGVLAGTDVPAAARRVVDVLVGEQFQSEVALSMFVEPARDDIELPELFVRFADRPDLPTELDPQVVTDNRERWIAEWTELVLG
jgi:thiamine transport system substrate-binding protein